MPQGRALSQLLYLRDGHYIDGETRALQLSIVTINPTLRAYGFFRLRIAREGDGLFHGKALLTAATTWDGLSAVDAVMLLVTAVHAAALALDFLRDAAAFVRGSSCTGTALAMSLAVGGGTCVLQLLCVLVFAAASHKAAHVPVIEPTTYAVYADAASVVPRMLLPFKGRQSVIDEHTYTGTASPLGSGGSCDVQSEMRPEWARPDDNVALAALLSSQALVEDLAHWRAAYAVLQGLCALAVIANGLRHAQKTPQLRVYVEALVLAARTIVEMAIVMFSILGLIAFLLHIIIGPASSAWSRLSISVEGAALQFLVGALCLRGALNAEPAAA